MNKQNLKLQTLYHLLAPPQMKYLSINLIKYVQDLYEENYKTLMNKLKELNKWRDITCTWERRLNIFKILAPLNLIYRFSVISIKTQASFVADK